MQQLQCSLCESPEPPAGYGISLKGWNEASLNESADE